MLTEFSSVSTGTAAHKVIKSRRTCSSIDTGVGETVILQVTGVTLKSCKKVKDNPSTIIVYNLFASNIYSSDKTIDHTL